MSGRGSPIDQVHQQRTLQTEDRNRLAAIMHTAINTMGLRDVRPAQVTTEPCIIVTTMSQTYS